MHNQDYRDFNAKLNMYGEDGEIQFDKDREAARQYFLKEVNPNTVFFHNLREKLDYLIENEYYDKDVLDQYEFEFVKSLFKSVYAKKFRFPSFLGALKFYTQYAMRTDDGKRFLERYEDRISMVALYLAKGDEEFALRLADDMIEGRTQPATPTFLNAGKKRRGELVSCFPEGTLVATNYGYTEIQNLSVGEQVLTDNGEYHLVSEVMERISDNDGVTVSYDGGSFTATDEHPVLISTSREGINSPIVGDGDHPESGIIWVAASDIAPGDKVIFPNEYGTLSNREVTSVVSADLFGQKVYNLEVDNRHTYVVDKAVVHNCFIIRAEDNMESITSTIGSSLQLSKIGGGVGVCLTNLREQGSSIKGLEGAASGVVPVAKLLEDSFSYANQLGQRQGAGAAYISAAHPDFMSLLDTKRENADEKVRIKTLSIGVVIPDILFQLGREDKDMYQFSPLDVYKVYGKEMSEISITEKYHEMVENPNIKKKKVSARKIFQTIAELQFESGYPYLMFEDTVNEWHIASSKRVSSSNLCSEILQGSSPNVFNEDGTYGVEGEDISCNLASLNIGNAMRSGDLGRTVDTAIRALTTVSDETSIKVVPSVRNGNESSHAVGLGAMNLHGFLGSEKIHYGSDEALDFVNCYFAAVKYHSLFTSTVIAEQRGETYRDFKESGYFDPNGEISPALDRYYSGVWRTTPQTQRIKDMFEEYGQFTPTPEDWRELAQRIAKHGLYHAYLMATAPTGSISYVNNSTSSVHPIVSKVEIRKEGKIGRVYAPSPGMNNDNMEYFTDAYELGFKPVIDTYAVAQKHIDQGQSLTMFFKDSATTRDLNKAYIYAWSKKHEKSSSGLLALDDPETSWKAGFIKTLYYSRIRQAALEGTEAEGCISCTI